MQVARSMAATRRPRDVQEQFIRGAAVRIFKTKRSRGNLGRRGRPRDRPGAPRPGADPRAGLPRGGQ
eukprot:7351389-Pyramimonas_sp.AAC.1